MNVHITYKVSKTPDLEKLVNQQTEKLGRYLQVFRPDLVHLKGIVSENSARQGFGASLNLRLPSGQMASEKNGPNATAAIKINVAMVFIWSSLLLIENESVFSGLAIA